MTERHRRGALFLSRVLMDAFTIALLLALGAFAGFAAGLLGVGGGMLMVPFMTMLLSAQGFAPEQIIKVAIATSLTTIAFTSISSVRAHHRRGAVRWDAARALAPGILIGSLLAAQGIDQIPRHCDGVHWPHD